MKLKTTIMVAIAASSLLVFSNNVQAAKKSIPTQSTTYIYRGNSYNLHLKVAGKVTIKTNAKYTLRNTSKWECIPYMVKTKNDQVFYLRAGNYTLAATSTAKVKTSYTKLSKLRSTIDSFPNSRFLDQPNKISLNKTYLGFNDMFHDRNIWSNNTYEFTLSKPQKVTMTMSTMPVYASAKTNIFSNNVASITPKTQYNYQLKKWQLKGQVTKKDNSWYLTQGTYQLTQTNLRGRYQFKLTASDTNQVPTQNEVTKVTSTQAGLQVAYTKAINATGYDVYALPADDSSFVYGLNEYKNSYPNTLSQIIPTNNLINGQTYQIVSRPIVTQAGNNIYAANSIPLTYTYYVSIADQTIPAIPNLKVSYYDDDGNDEPSINLSWNIQKLVNSYEIAYRLKGSTNWQTFFTKESNGTEITDSPNQAALNYFVKGKTYEIKVRALHGNLMSPWTDLQTVTVNVTPQGNK